MKVVAAVFADFVDAPLGGPSQLRTELGGAPILVRTLQRVRKIEGLAGRCLYVRPRDRDVAKQVLRSAGLTHDIDLVAEDTGERVRGELIRAARTWCQEAWRGNPLGMTWFDEFVDPVVVANVLNHYKCHAVFCFDGHQPVLDPALASAMLPKIAQNLDAAKAMFTQAPPGLAGLILRREALEDLLELTVPVGLLFSYRPELAQIDPITHASCYHVEPEIMQTATRLTGDTRRSRELLEAALAELGQEVSAVALCRWVRRPGHDRAGPLPVEIEIELTTEDPLPNTTLRPRGERVPKRALTDLDAVRRVAEELAEYDDRLVFLGGHGDPLLHPRFSEVCGILRAAGVAGIAIATPLLDVSEAAFAALFEHRSDVVEVLLDAFREATYERVHGAAGLPRVLKNLHRIETTRNERHAPRPIPVCSQTRCAATISELEAFHDHWIQALGSAVIHGYNDYCGVMPADPMLPAQPPLRGPCRRLNTRLMLLADGTITACQQDLRAELVIGNWFTDSLRETWGGAALSRIREAHQNLALESLPLCNRCKEWHRP